MAQLRQDYNQFENENTAILVIGPENQTTFARYWAENNLPFTGLPDPNHSVLKLYGQKVKLFKFGRMPAMVIISKQGIVRFVHYGHSMSDIPQNQDVLKTLRMLNHEESEIENINPILVKYEDGYEIVDVAP
jgi:peroxiredoxin Q/BCP